MAVIVIFVQGADTEPDPLPVYVLDNQDHATLICEGLKESEYRIFNFAMKNCTHSDRGRFAVWAKMAIDVRDGVYGSVAAGIYNMIDEAHAIISQRRANQRTVENSNGDTQSAGGSVLPSSKPKNPTKTVDNSNAALAREQLRPHVELPSFREYLKSQILEWELWHLSHTEEINEYVGLRDKAHQELKELQGRDFRHSEVLGDFDPLGHAEICYENYRDVAAWLIDDPEYKLVADREPVLFKEASIAAIVALFWCDVNHSTMLAPEYDFLEPEGPFIEYLREQWQNPIRGRYKHIDWFVEATTSLYECTIKNDCTGLSDEHELVEQSDSSKVLPEAALKAVIDGGLASVFAAASRANAVTKHSHTMMAMLKTDNKYYAWSADDWVTHLKAAKGTILATDA